jgi:bZIP transcription factor
MDIMAAAIRSNDDPLAAALAAAAALARNGGAFFLNAPVAVQQPSQNVPTTAATSTAVVSNGASTLMVPPPTILPPSIAALLSAATDISTVAPKQHPKYDPDHEEEDEDDGDEDDDGENTEEDAERRIARSRERNREHARRTRLRKKAQLQDLQSQVKGLQAESKVLKQSLEECSIASILVGLSSGERDATIQSLLREANAIESKEIFQVVAGKRKRFLSDADSSSCERLTPAQQVLEIKAKNGTIIRVGGGRSQINWKSGLYVDEDGIQRQLTHEQLECLR